ncbi:MAG: methyltransferase [Verrucomicrobia bacterium]|nr:methyltransferase [Verrucomicrobiota bacterium]
MLPLTVLRRFDCVLASTKEKVLADYAKRKGGKLNDDALDRYLNKAAGQRFHNHSPLNFAKLRDDPDHIEKHLVSYIKGFSSNVRTIFEYFEFESEIEKMREADILYLVVSKFAEVDLHPDRVPNPQMGLIFENLIRRFNELANETAGDHFTPREVIRLMVHILFSHDDHLLATRDTVRKLLDPACGTGGMLAEAQTYLREHHQGARLFTYGQDYNKRAFATAASDMLMKEVDQNAALDTVRFGDIFTEDRFPNDKFDYLLANPPFGVDWKKQFRVVDDEHRRLGFQGRFGAGLPRVNDGSFLFLQHMVSKFEPVSPTEHKIGSRLALVFSGSPLFSGGAGSGESEIRRWIIEQDWLEAIVALPEQMFYNTGIGTYIWIVTNRKERRRKGKVQLVDARDYFIPMERSLGDKRRKIGEGRDGEPDQISEIVRLYHSPQSTKLTKLLDNADFGYTRVVIERPLRLSYQMTVERKTRFLDACPHLLEDVQAVDAEIGRELLSDWNVIKDRFEQTLERRKSKWKTSEIQLFRNVFTQPDPAAAAVNEDVGPTKFEADPALRDYENVPLTEKIENYFTREVAPNLPDAWMNRAKDTVGYEISFNRYFYNPPSTRPLAKIDEDLKKAQEEFMRHLKEIIS